jgi:hypothetical protein
MNRFMLHQFSLFSTVFELVYTRPAPVARFQLMKARQMTFKPSKSFLFCLAFFCANLVLSSFYLDIWPTPNPVSRALPVLTFSQNRTLQIDKYADQTIDKSKVGEHFYSDKAPLPTVLMIPVYELMRLLHLDRASETAGKNFPIYIWRPNGLEDGRQETFTEIIPALVIGSFLIGSLPFAGIVLLSYAALKNSGSRISPIVLAMLSFYGSFIFVYSGTFFNHVFAGFLLLVSYIKLKEGGYFWSGLFLGFAFLTEYTVFVAVPVWLVLIVVNQRNYKQALRFVLGLLPSGIAIMFYNWYIAGSPFTALNAYHAHDTYKKLSHFYGLSFPSLDAIWGLSFSGSMGIFVFAPVLLIAGFLFARRMFADNSAIENIKSDYLAWFSILFFLAIGSFFTWWGGWSYGPRYLTVLAVLLVYEGLIFISKFDLSRTIFVALAGYGLLSAWLAKSTLAYMIPDYFLRREGYSNSFFNIIVPEVSAGRYNSNNFLSYFLNISPGISSFAWIALFLSTMLGFAAWHRNSLAQTGIPKSASGKRVSARNKKKKR